MALVIPRLWVDAFPTRCTTCHATISRDQIIYSPPLEPQPATVFCKAECAVKHAAKRYPNMLPADVVGGTTTPAAPSADDEDF